MKNLYLIVFAVLITATSCQKDKIANQSKFDDSYKAWRSYKASVNNSYKYTQRYGSFTGSGIEITISVSNGKIISRDFTSFQYKQNSPDYNVIKQWHEDEASLNTHGNVGGELLTIDDVYNKARTVWLKADTKTNDIYLDLSDNGLISSCGYVPRGCQDDCFNGVKIVSVTAL